MLEIKEVSEAKVRLLLPVTLAKKVHSLVGRKNQRPTHCDREPQNRFHRHPNVVPA
jgi:hypothetical protein